MRRRFAWSTLLVMGIAPLLMECGTPQPSGSDASPVPLPEAGDARHQQPAKVSARSKASVDCTIEPDGRPAGCVVTSLVGDPEFAAYVLQKAEADRYKPATHLKEPVAYPHSDFHAEYVMPSPSKICRNSISARPRSMAALRFPPQLFDAGETARLSMACDIEVDGTAQNCRVSQRQGRPDFVAHALAFTHAERYSPAICNGVPIVEHHSATITFGPG